MEELDGLRELLESLCFQIHEAKMTQTWKTSVHNRIWKEIVESIGNSTEAREIVLRKFSYTTSLGDIILFVKYDNGFLHESDIVINGINVEREYKRIKE